MKNLEYKYLKLRARHKKTKANLAVKDQLINELHGKVRAKDSQCRKAIKETDDLRYRLRELERILMAYGFTKGPEGWVHPTWRRTNLPTPAFSDETETGTMPFYGEDAL